MRKYTLCLIAMLLMPFAMWAQTDVLKKMVAAADVPQQFGLEKQASKYSEEQVQADAKAMKDFAEVRAQGDKQEATDFQGTVSLDREITFLGDAKAVKGTIPAQSAPRKAPRKAAAKLVLGGYYAQDTSYSGSTYLSNMTLQQDSLGNYQMAKVYNQADTVPLTVDLTAGTVKITPQVLYTNSSYGKIWIAPVYYNESTKTYTYSNTKDIEGTIDENGNISLSTWGILVLDETSKYNGRLINAFSSSKWLAHNSTITRVKSTGDVANEDALVEQISDNEIRIYNLAGTAYSVTATITPQKTVKISPQTVLYNAFYGYFYCYPAEITTKTTINMTQPIVGTFDGDSIAIGNWVVCQRNSLSGVLTKYMSTTIHTTLNIAWPKAVEVSFKGEGTEASPYLISTAADLTMLSQAVNGGESYQGKYFRQTADISLGSLTSAYQPVGEETAAFNGTYDGASFTISDLSLSARGFSNMGVFGYVGTEGTVKNLNIKNFKVVSYGSNIAFAVGYNAGRVENIAVTSSANSSQSDCFGAVVGYNAGTVTECSSDATNKLSNNGNLGGVVGMNYGTVTNCYSTARLSVSGLYSSYYHSAGGVVGYSAYTKGKRGTITDCWFAGQIYDALTSSGTTYGFSRSGGIVGSALDADVSRCFNTGVIYQGEDYTETVAMGGLVGVSSGSTFTNCYNAGMLTKLGTGKRVGGIAGYLSLIYTYSGSTPVPGDMSKFTDCYNSGLVYASSTHVNSGIIGDYFKLTSCDPFDQMFFNCYNDMQVTGLDDGTFNKPTSFFTSGTLPTSFSSSVWTAEANYYPVLKNFATAQASKVSSASVALVGGENRLNVKKNFTFYAPEGFTWGLSSSTSDTYVSSNDALSLSGNAATIKDIYSSEFLVAYNSDLTLQKIFLLAIVPKVFDGDGTESSPYLIKSASDFEKLYSAVTEHHQPHAGDFFKMTNDIDFTGSSFIGVNGKQTYFFSGTFDGDNHYIHNLNISAIGKDAETGRVSQNESYNYAGLFGACSVKSTIKNIRMAADNSFTFYACSSPIVAVTQGKVINCRNYADVKAYGSYVAGIVGVTDSVAVVSGCYNAGNITSGSSGVAGIVGYNYKDSKVELCQNDGTIIADSIDYCGTKQGNQTTAAGIVSYNYGQVDRCVNGGTIAAYSKVGGIVAQNLTTWGGSTINNAITGCVNTGLISAWKTEDLNRGCIMGATNRKTFADNYYDSSVGTYGGVYNTNVNGATGLSTASLTSGNALTGLSTDDYSFKAGSYPVLKAFQDEEAAKAMRNTYIGFADGEVVTNVVKATSLSADSNIKWALKQNKNFSLGTNVLNVTVPTEKVLASDTLTAVYADKYTKVYFLGSVPAILDGAGTAQSPFQIKTKADMDNLAEFIEESGMEYAGYFFKVMNDIDYAGDTIKIIAKNTTNFKGDFDGNGKTIKGYVYSDTQAKTGKYKAIFENLGNGGVIHDLTIDGKMEGHSYVGGLVCRLYGTLRNCVQKGSVSATAGSYAGGLTCYAYEGADIDNCQNEGTVTVKTSYAGGIACWMYAGTTIENCTNKATITVPSSYAGGIASYFGGTMKNCANEGKINAKATIGGLISYATGSGCTIDSCRNTVDITATGGTLGGLVGAYGTKTVNKITNSYNTGNLKATGYIGGIIATGGGTSTYATSEIANCYNTGNITSVSTSGRVGGIAGSLYSSKESSTYAACPNTVSNCYNTGTVTSGGGQYLGGIAGYAYGDLTDITDCYNLGDVNNNAQKSNYGIGGIAGGAYGTVENSWNSGKITSAYYGVGGVSGLGYATAKGCANFGDIVAGTVGASQYNGGIWGYQYPKLYNCYNLGSITAPSKTSGINGLANGGFVADSCYNAGKITITSDKKMCSNILYASNATAIKNSTVRNTYYDLSQNPEALPNDTLGFGSSLPTQQMFSAPLGDGYEYNKAAYPTNSNFKVRSVPNFYASNIEYIEQGDTATNITGKFYYAALEGVTVTSSDNISLNAGEATPTAVGEGWIKYETELHGKKFEKTFTVTIVKATGIDSITDGGKEVLSREYYDINGVRFETPRPGKLYIMKSLYTDGTTAVKKIYVK